MSTSISPNSERELVCDLATLEDLCGNFLERTGASDKTPTSHEVEPYAERIHTQTGVVLARLRTKSDPPSIPSSVEVTPESGPRKAFLFEPLIRSVQELDDAKEPRRLITTSASTLIAARKVLSDLQQFTLSPLPPAEFHERALPLAKIAAADDDSVIRKMLSQRLLTKYKEGDIPTATNGTEVIEELLPAHGDELDILFLDNSMPGMNGVAIIPLIRAHPTWSKIVVIFLTSASGYESTYKALGFDGYLTKPTSKEAISVCLNSLFTSLSCSSDPKDERRWITKHH